MCVAVLRHRKIALLSVSEFLLFDLRIITGWWEKLLYCWSFKKVFIVI